MVVSERSEDYLEALFQLEMDDAPRTVTALAERLKITKGTAATGVKKMTEQGYVNHAAYGRVDLTDEGRRIGWLVYMKHERLKNFFDSMLEIDPDQAEEIACLIEHHLDGAASDRFFNLIAFLTEAVEKGEPFAGDLKSSLRRPASLPEPLTLYQGKTGTVCRGDYAGCRIDDITETKCAIDGREVALTPALRGKIWVRP